MLRKLAIGAYLVLCMVLLALASMHRGPAPPVVIAHSLYLGG